MVIQELKLIEHINLARRIKFGSSLLEEEDLQEDLSLEFVNLYIL